MGHVGIVAGILDDAGGRRPVAPPIDGSAKARSRRREGDLDGIGEVAGEQRRVGRLGGGRGAGAGRPAAPELGHAWSIRLMARKAIELGALACHREGARHERPP